MATELKPTWNLDVFFPGGSTSPAFQQYLDELGRNLQDLRGKVEALGSPEAPVGVDQWAAVLELTQNSDRMALQSASFVSCLMAENVKDEPAKLKWGRILHSFAGLETVSNDLDAKLLALSDTAFEKLVSDRRMQPVAFVLRERRERAKDKMDPRRENLATDLSVTGYHGWGSLYDMIVGRITIPIEKDGKVEEMSVGQASNEFAEPDREHRKRVFTKWEEAWGKDAELIGATLNNLAGYRLDLYRHRGWESVLKEPLAVNRMSEATLNAMWAAVTTARPKLKQYLQRKAKVKGWESFNWYDIGAPFSTVKKKVSYEEAAAFIIEHFGRFSPDMADFAHKAFHDRWIEVEDRPNKAPGGFCTGFPDDAQSRIFMTYAGDAGGVSTLAHELGHAYHSHVMFDQPMLTQMYAMNVAETASTFAELITTNAAIAKAATKEEKLALLDDKVDTAVGYLMNIHARFLFESRFYDARRKGALSIDELKGLMEQAQKETYADALGVYDPLFWASKGHFYATGAPFYNFPYTFGYLFSAGIYARAMQEGPSFQRRYVALLQDTGRMMVEDLARKHLDADLTKPDFWLTGVNLALKDVDDFLALTAQ